MSDTVYISCKSEIRNSFLSKFAAKISRIQTRYAVLNQPCLFSFVAQITFDEELKLGKI